MLKRVLSPWLDVRVLLVRVRKDEMSRNAFRAAIAWRRTVEDHQFILKCYNSAGEAICAIQVCFLLDGITNRHLSV